jgi:hypothetical protein
VDISIEMVEHSRDPNGKRYGVIHKAGCRDMRDEMPIGSAETLAEVQAVADDMVCWDNHTYRTAPCVTLR